MTWETYWLPNLVQWTLGSLVSVLVGLYVRRLLRMNQAQVDRVVDAVEGVFGGVRVPSADRAGQAVPSPPTDRKEPTVDLARYRKAIGAGAGVLLIGLLTYATTSTELRALLESLLPAPLVPLVGVAIGGVAAVLAVIKATNAPEPSPYRRASTSPVAVTILEPAPSVVSQAAMLAGAASDSGDGATTVATDAPPPAVQSASVATAASSSQHGPFWAGVEAGEPLAATGMVQLAPVPQRDYR